jgi:organic hydroperoxide reductase OsmC/OhrA
VISRADSRESSPDNENVYMLYMLYMLYMRHWDDDSLGVRRSLAPFKIIVSNQERKIAKSHDYAAHLAWNGNLGEGTATYAGYGRDYTVSIAGRPDIRGSADPMFRGNPNLNNPEEMFLAAIASCHMLSYLALCARKGISVLSYEDNIDGTLVFTADGGGSFERVTLRPVVTIADASKYDAALALHEDAHRQCYIASSCRTLINHVATINLESRV